MKICKNCGTSVNDSTVICPHCGGGNLITCQSQPVYKEPISVGGWIGRSLIPCIPLVGGLVYLIMLFIWSDDTTKETSFRNWAKAQLIFTCICIVLGFLAVILAYALGASA